MACVCGMFVNRFRAVLRPSCEKFGAMLWPIFTACVWTVCCADMLDCVLIYVDICVSRYIDMDGCKLYVTPLSWGSHSQPINLRKLVGVG